MYSLFVFCGAYKYFRRALRFIFDFLSFLKKEKGLVDVPRLNIVCWAKSQVNNWLENMWRKFGWRKSIFVFLSAGWECARIEKHSLFSHFAYLFICFTSEIEWNWIFFVWKFHIMLLKDKIEADKCISNQLFVLRWVFLLFRIRRRRRRRRRNKASTQFASAVSDACIATRKRERKNKWAS